MSAQPKPEVVEFQYIQRATAWNRTLGTFARWCQPQANERVLDIGCGPGLLPALFRSLGCRASGIDLDEAMFQPVPLYPKVVCGDAIRLPFSAGSFDLITASNLLFFLPTPAEALAEMHRVVSRDGRICLINPSPRLSISAAADVAEKLNLDEAACHSPVSWAQRADNHQRWSPDALQELCKTAGLEITTGDCRVGPGFALFAMARKDNQ